MTRTRTGPTIRLSSSTRRNSRLANPSLPFAQQPNRLPSLRGDYASHIGRVVHLLTDSRAVGLGGDTTYRDGAASGSAAAGSDRLPGPARLNKFVIGAALVRSMAEDTLSPMA